MRFGGCALAVLVGSMGCSGNDGRSCTVADNGDGTATVSCDDGTRSVVRAPAGPGGPQGSAGPTTLVRQDAEPARTNCPTGGVAVKSGVDRNGDGKLEDDEVTSTSYICNTAAGTGLTLEGDYFIDNSLDVAVIASYPKITGNLTVSSDAGAKIALPNLVEVGGTLTVHGGGADVLTSVSFPALTKSDAIALVANTKLTIFDAPALTALGTGPNSGIVVQSDPLLATVNLGALTAAQNLTVQQSTFAGLGNFAKLTSVPGVLAITDNASLTDTDALGALTTIGSLDVARNAALTSLGFAGLTTTTGSISIADNATLATVAFPVLATIGSLDVARNAALTSLGFAGLTTTTGSISIADNATLAMVAFPVLATQGTNLPKDAFTVTGAAVTSLSIPVLAKAGAIDVSSTALTTFEAPKLVEAGGLGLRQDAKCSAVTLPVLATIDGALLVDGAAAAALSLPALTTVAGKIEVSDAASMTTLGFPVLKTVGATMTTSADMGSFVVSGNDVLTSLVAPMFTTMLGPAGCDPYVCRQFWILSNPKLKQCSAQLLAAQITPAPGRTTITNNNTTGTCP